MGAETKERNVDDTTEALFPVLLAEAGSIQVFTYQTQREIESRSQYNTVYWQDRSSRTVYGPFVSVSKAFDHFTSLLGSQQDLVTPPLDSALSNVFHVDFVTKQRIVR